MTKEEFATIALKYLGYPAVKYRGPEAGRDINGFDCSGFVTFLLKLINFPAPLPRHCNEYFDALGIFVHNYQVGDLVFFSFGNGGVWPSHMGIMLSEKEYIYSHGSDDSFVKIGKLQQKRIVTPEKQEHVQIYMANPIGFKRLAIKNGRYQKTFLS